MAIQDDISEGLFKIINKPFQVENLAFPYRFAPVRDANGDLAVFNTEQTQFTEGSLNNLVEGEYLVVRDVPAPNTTTWSYYKIERNFDLSVYSQSELSSFGVVIHKGEDFPAGSLDLPFSVTVSTLARTPAELTSAELAKIENIVRIQWHDDDLHPNNSLVEGSVEPPSIIGLGGDYFADKRLDPAFDDIILSIDPPPTNYTPEQWTAFINRIQPDLILHNNYPWQDNGTGLNFRQREYGMYSRTILWSGRGQAGGDTENPTGNPIPFGVYMQTSWLGTETPISLSLRKYQAYFNLLFGAKYLAGFVYNDLSTRRDEGLESILFDENGEYFIGEEKNPTPQFYQQAQLNKELKIIGNTLKLLSPTGQRFLRATNIEFFLPQGIDFAGGVYDWDYGTRPDTRLTDVIVSRDDVSTTQDVWVGYFNPIHDSLDGSGTTDEVYWMITNGSWDSDDDIQIRQRIRMEFDFGEDNSIKNIIKLSHKTGFLEVIPLIPMGGNTYYYEHVLEPGEGDLFKYDTGVQFIGDPTPQVQQLDGIDYSPPFNYPGGLRVSNDDPIDADRYLQNNIAERNLLVTQGRAKEGQQCYVKNIGDNTSELYVLRGTTNLDWRPIWQPLFQLADMYKSDYDTNDSGVVDDSEKLGGELPDKTPTEDTIVSRNEDGDIEARLFKSSFVEANSIDTTATVAMRNNDSPTNNFIRFINKAGFANWLGFNKATIDGLGINAGQLSGKNLNVAAVADTVVLRTADGKIAALGFGTPGGDALQVLRADGTVANITKTEIENLQIDAFRLQGLSASQSASSLTIPVRDVDGFIASLGFKTNAWEITQNAGVLVFKNTQTGIDYEIAMPLSESGIIATKAYADKYYWEDAYLITGQAITANTDTTITLTSATIENSGNLTGVIGTNGTITPTILNGWIDVTITFNFATPATQGYLDVFLEVDGVKYRNNHHNMGKSNGVIDTVTANFGLPVKSTFFTNGGIMKINSSENITITDKYVAVKI